MLGLILDSQAIAQILTGKKTWVIRAKRTHIRGTIGLIEKGTGKVVAICELANCQGPLSSALVNRNQDKLQIPSRKSRNLRGYYAWIVANVRRLKQAITYKHRSGASVWHRLPDSVARKAPLVIRGRYFSPASIMAVMNCVERHFDRGRTAISEIICRRLRWKQPNGWLKDRACRDALRRLEQIGLIALPPKLTKPTATETSKTKKVKSTLSSFDLNSRVTVVPEEITLEFAKGDEKERVWNELITKYHYLGHQVQVGRCIKYLVRTEDTLLGAVAFSSPSWNLAVRDRLLQRIGILRTEVRDAVINNSRFLILPHVAIPNLASRILSMATKRILDDWGSYYSITPQVAETFVQPSKFLGTCYKAANWIQVGVTKGYAKKGGSYRNSQEPKLIFLYGLNPTIRKQLVHFATQKPELV